MKANSIFLIALVNTLLFAFSLQTQAQTFQWVKQMGGSDSESGKQVCIDVNLNVYSTGSFEGTVDFDPGPGIANLTSKGDKDIYVQKMDPNGNFLWVKQIGGTGSNFPKGIATDAAGNVYSTGYFESTADFDPGLDSLKLTSAGRDDIYIQKLDVNGNLLWAIRMGGIYPDKGNSITIDTNGDVITTGEFYTTVDFDPGPGTTKLASGGNLDVFIQKLDASGNLIWAVRVGGDGFEMGNSITCDANNNIYTTGTFGSDSTDFDPGPGTTYLKSRAFSSDIFIQKLDPNANFVWAKQISGSGSKSPSSIALDATGNVYTTGGFQNTADFDPGVGTLNLTSSGSGDIYIQKLDTSGSLLWAKQIGGLGSDRGYSLTTDVDGNIYTTGSFQSTVDFDPGVGTMSLTCLGDYDMFIQKLNGNSDLLWVEQIGGTGIDIGSSVTTDSKGNLYYTGAFGDTTDFDKGIGISNLTSMGQSDIFILKLDPCLIAKATLSGTSITANGASANYAWLDCNNSYSPIPGETNKSYSPLINGSYAVEITTNGCLDTSACIAVTNLGIVNKSFQDIISIHPNPSSGTFNITFDSVQETLTLKLLSISGQEMKKETFQNTSNLQFEINQPSGMYFLEITNQQNQKAVYKVIRE